MSSYVVRRSRNKVVETYTDELKSSKLFLINNTTAKKDGRTFLLKWIINNPLHLLKGVIYAAQYIRLDKRIHRLRIAKFEQGRVFFLVGMTPYWRDNIRVTVSIMDTDFTIEPEMFTSSHFNIPDQRCFFVFDEYPYLGNKLTILITVETDDSTVEIDINRYSDLVPDMQNLMDSADLSDFTVLVGGEEFKVHMAVLSARSPVFKAMFTTNMQEKNTRQLVIKDQPDGRTFRQFVRYLYTGKTEPLDQNMALGLLEWADKYEVGDLRREVVEFLTHNLNKDSFLRAYVAADAFLETDLKKVACSQIAENLKAMMESSDWSLVKHRPDLLEDILKNFGY